MHSTAKVSRKTSGLRHHVRMAVVPHAANEYRPHLLRWQGISAVLLAVVFFQSIYFAIQQGQVLGQSADITSTRLLLETNRERERNGEQALSLSTDLSPTLFARQRILTIDKERWQQEMGFREEHLKQFDRLPEEIWEAHRRVAKALDNEQA